MIRHIDHIKQLGLWAFAAAAVAWTGCTGDADIEDPVVGRPSEYLSFTATLASSGSSAVGRGTSRHIETEIAQWALQTGPASENATRGSLTTVLGGNAGIMGFMYDPGDAVKTPLAPDNNIEFAFNGDALASVGTPIRWNAIDKAKMDIFAYAPYTVDGLTVNNAASEPTLTYTVPNAVADQKDIIISTWQGAVADHKANNTAIHLTFDHALTAVRFKAGFDCTVKSVKLEGVYKKGEYKYSSSSGEWEWTPTPDAATDGNYTVDFGAGKSVAKNAMLTDGDNTMILLPQTLPAGAKIILTCTDDRVLTATIGGNDTKWEAGKLITYTLYDQEPPETIYFDLAADNVLIKANSYSGKVYKGGGTVDVTGTHKSGNHYYVYQSTEDNRGSIWNGNVCTPPTYPEVKGPDGRPWREFITNNPNVESVINAWSIEVAGSPCNDKLAKDAGREGTDYRIDIEGNVTCEVTIDNIYSTYQEPSTNRKKAGISFAPKRYSTATNAKVTIKILGDNRVGAVHYSNGAGNSNELIFEGTGSLTVADVDGIMRSVVSLNDVDVGLEAGESGYYSNHWDSAIGGHDDSTEQEVYGLVINSGTIFAGTTKAENCTAIGGGGNEHGQVTINGGTVTAVATTTGAAIGGGIGFNGEGGTSDVTITGGNVYAYNHANKWKCPSSAIGGGSSINNCARKKSTVNISGGYIYAESAGGPGIGAGSSATKDGGNIDLTITGGEIIAQTQSLISASIGGGSACTFGENTAGAGTHFNGGYANIEISGNPIIRTGSIGGGGTGDAAGSKGNATILVSGGDTQAQFILAAGTGEGVTPSFTMTGGKIQGSNTSDEEYTYVEKNGGAVYLENGNVRIEGGTIENCRAERGGAIYISGTGSSTFTMIGGTIQDNASNSDGGAIYMEGGTATILSGTIANNLARGGNGGGICISGGSLIMKKSEDGSTPASIYNNSAEVNSSTEAFGSGNGGGAYISSAETNITAELLSGAIYDNTAGRRGGGVCVYMNSETYGATVSVGLEGGAEDSPNIQRNHALIEGGGLYAQGKNAHITINSGTILNNTVSQYVYNNDVANQYGDVTLNNGTVTHVEVKFFANDGKSSNTEPQHIQKIVTSTNSTLVAPVFHNTGYKLVGWNTKPSGRGENYTDGQRMNVNTDISLYAMWELDVH